MKIGFTSTLDSLSVKPLTTNYFWDLLGQTTQYAIRHTIPGEMFDMKDNGTILRVYGKK